jgi:hypothetical protein
VPDTAEEVDISRFAADDVCARPLPRGQSRAADHRTKSITERDVETAVVVSVADSHKSELLLA